MATLAEIQVAARRLCDWRQISARLEQGVPCVEVILGDPAERTSNDYLPPVPLIYGDLLDKIVEHYREQAKKEIAEAEEFLKKAGIDTDNLPV